MSEASAPLVDLSRIRVSYLGAHVAAYLIGAATLVLGAGVDSTPVRVILGIYLTVVAVSLLSLIRGWGRLTYLLVIDALMVASVSWLTGQHPAATHLGLMVILLTAMAIASGRITWVVASIAGLSVVTGIVLGPHDPLLTVTPAHVVASEKGAMAAGVLAAGVAIVVLSRVLRDSMRRQAEALEAQQRSARLQQRFIAMVSHELRTPLTSILGFAEVLDQAGDEMSDGEQAEFIGAIAEQSAHLSRLVDDVLAVLRIESNKLSIVPECLDVGAVVAAALTMVSVPEGKSVRRPALTSVQVMADRDRLVQVVRNLVENGLKHGGDLVEVSVDSAGSIVRVTVEDNGVGVPGDMVEEVFDEFVQLGNPAERVAAGFGLGLPIARRMIDAMGGRIAVRRSELGGAAFVVELPSALDTVQEIQV